MHQRLTNTSTDLDRAASEDQSVLQSVIFGSIVDTDRDCCNLSNSRYISTGKSIEETLSHCTTLLNKSMLGSSSFQTESDLSSTWPMTFASTSTTTSQYCGRSPVGVRSPTHCKDVDIFNQPWPVSLPLLSHIRYLIKRIRGRLTAYTLSPNNECSHIADNLTTISIHSSQASWSRHANPTERLLKTYQSQTRLSNNALTATTGRWQASHSFDIRILQYWKHVMHQASRIIALSRLQG